MYAGLIVLSLVLQDPAPKTNVPAAGGTSVDTTTPEQAIRTFILAMATKDAAKLRAVTRKVFRTDCAQGVLLSFGLRPCRIDPC